MARIMVVDDEPDALKMVKTFLEREDYEVVTASNGDECWDKLRKEGVDLILLDILMPGTTPVELIEKIRKDKKLSSAKVVYHTVVEFTEKELEKADISGYIHKSFDSANMVRRVRQILSEQSGWSNVRK